MAKTTPSLQHKHYLWHELIEPYKSPTLKQTWTFDVSIAEIVSLHLLSLNGIPIRIDAVTSGPMTLLSCVITIGFAIRETQVHNHGRSVEEVVGFDGRVTAGKLWLSRADTIGQDVRLGDGCLWEGVIVGIILDLISNNP